MESRQFLLNCAPDAGEMSHFELRHNDDERPFHLSIRPSTGRFVINDMRDTVWGEEDWHDLPAGFSLTDPILIHHEGAEVLVFWGGLVLRRRLPAAPEKAGRLLPVAKGLGWRLLEGGQAPTIAGGRLASLPLPHGRLHLPAQTPSALAFGLLRDALVDLPAYLRFLAAAPLPPVPHVLDVGTPLLALAHASLLPQSKVRIASDEPRLMAALAAANGLANVEAVALSEPRGAVDLLQGRGPDVPQAAGSSALIYTDGTARTPFPAAPAVVLPAVQQAATIRPGLDVVVALYNTAEHIVDCVTSLLVPGRQDIGVIVVDDGSGDGGGALIERQFGDDPRVRLVRKENGGCASARNFGRLLSDRAHLAFVDADDWVDPGFFAGLYDLALASEAPMVQGGFDYFDTSAFLPRWPFGGDVALADLPLETVGGIAARRVPAARLLRAQPAIWRKVFRRDFLDRHALWFPESIRAYDDYLFHLLTLAYAPESWALPGPRYVYRQHPAQDIRQGDARHFNMLSMFSMLARRAAAERWSEFKPYAETMTDAIHWSSERLQPALLGGYLRAAAQVCVAVHKAFGDEVMGPAQLATVRHPDFMPLYRQELAFAAPWPNGRWAAATEPFVPHPKTVAAHLHSPRCL